jgi:hypothetical protein
MENLMTIETIVGFLDRHNLPWLLWALLSWLVIYLTCTRRQFWHAFPVGLWTALVGSILEHFFIENKFWVDHFILISIGKFDLFVAIGPFFALGVILIRFLPENAPGRFIAVFFWSVFAVLGELSSGWLGFLQYHPENWSALHSLVGYFIGLMSALGFSFSFYSISNEKS